MWNSAHFILMFSLMFIMATHSVQAMQPVQGWGRVNMQGAIIDTACTITVDSRDQTIDMDVVPLADIIRDGHGRVQSFNIELVNCELKRAGELSDRKQFQITFDGDADGDFFDVRGAASGVAIQIMDKNGNIAIPGNPLPMENISLSDMQLRYAIKLIANNRALKVGEYFSSIRFKLDYF